jgi:plastocyanin
MRSRVVVALLVVGVVAAACSSEDRDGALVVEDPTATTFDYDYFIPEGTGERFDAGEAIEILPAQLEVSVGEVLRIVNEDDRDHLVGPFFVGAGETLTQRFSTPGEFEGLCTVHPSGQFVLVVNP